MSGVSDSSSLWWPKFDGLYGELIEYITDTTPDAVGKIASLMQRQSHWLQQGVEGFKFPADQANSLLQKDSQLLLDGGKKLPIKTELRSAALALSKHLVLLFPSPRHLSHPYTYSHSTNSDCCRHAESQ